MALSLANSCLTGRKHFSRSLMVLETVLGSSKQFTSSLFFSPRVLSPNIVLLDSLANAEMRLILTKVLFNFDLKLEPQSTDWSTQKSFSLWQRPPLMVQLNRAGSNEVNPPA